MTSDLVIEEVTVRYRYGEASYKLTIPVTTAVNSIFFDRSEADIARRSIWEARREELGLGELQDPIKLDADGSNWASLDGEAVSRLSASVERLEALPSETVWAAEHTKRDLCIHEEGCMWFCLR